MHLVLRRKVELIYELSTKTKVPKSPNNVTSTCFNIENLLPKDIRFEHGGAKLASCPVRHLASLRLWVWWSYKNLLPYPVTGH